MNFGLGTIENQIRMQAAPATNILPTRMEITDES